MAALAFCRIALTLVLLHAAGLFPSAAQTPTKEQSLPGLHNFGQVTGTLFRGAQPDIAGYTELKRRGIEIVVSFREDPGQIAAERRAVEGLGLRFVSIPWPALAAPRNAQVAEFLEILRANPGKSIFAHCRRGAERTGVMVAAFRIAAERWTPQQALDEMEEFGFRGFWFHSLKTYVRKFPGLFESGPDFRPLAAPAN